MKAAVQTEYGPPEVVRVTDVDRPTPGDGDLLVRVHATSVNRTDCGYRSGKPRVVRLFSGLRSPKAQVLGNEFAGVVEAVGAKVSGFEVGDRVFGYVEGPFGGHAEYLTVPASASVAKVPPGVGFDQAAAATEGAHYALSFIRWAGTRPGQDVLVYGATGAIGSAAVQLLKSMGVDVTAVCDTDRVSLVEGLGADRVVDYLTEDFTKDDQRYDAVFDAVGKSSWGACKALLKPGGVYVSSELGPRSENPALALVSAATRGRALGGRRVAFPFPQHDQKMIERLAGLLESGELRPVVDRTYPLDEIVEAYRYVETGRKTGNVVIRVVPAD